MKIRETSFKRIPAHNIAFSAPNPAAQKPLDESESGE